MFIWIGMKGRYTLTSGSPLAVLKASETSFRLFFSSLYFCLKCTALSWSSSTSSLCPHTISYKFLVCIGKSCRTWTRSASAICSCIVTKRCSNWSIVYIDKIIKNEDPARENFKCMHVEELTTCISSSVGFDSHSGSEAYSVILRSDFWGTLALQYLQSYWQGAGLMTRKFIESCIHWASHLQFNHSPVVPVAPAILWSPETWDW